jgi:Holliday junction DNA helicase RuvB
MLEMEGIDALGFDQTEQKYLHLLRANQGAVRLNVIATHLGIPRQTVELLERDFIRLGLIDKTEKGRILTAAGIAHLRTTTT